MLTTPVLSGVFLSIDGVKQKNTAKIVIISDAMRRS